MRALFGLTLAAGLLAGESPCPGRDAAFVARVMAEPGDGSRPWKTFRPLAESASAVVEVVGELSPAEQREVAFREFLAWFHEDLRRFFRRWGGVPRPTDLAAATLPVDRFGGNPVPKPVPLGEPLH